MTHRRAVIATEFWHGSTGRGLAHGFRNLGWLVQEVDILAYAPIGRRLTGRIAGRLFKRSFRASYNDAILAAVKQHDADTFITVKGNSVDLATLAALAEAGVRRVNYYPDVEFAHHGMGVDQLPGYDVIATTKSFHLDFLRSLPGERTVELVQHGYSPLVHRPISVPADDAGFARDLLYVGNASPYKREWMIKLAEALPHRSMLIVGTRWADAAAGTALAGRVMEAVVGDFYADLIGSSRINIALHSGPVRTPGWEDKVSTRTFEIPAAGGFMLHVDNAEVRSLYRVGAEMDAFATPSDLIDRVEHHLTHAEQRRAIAAAGHARAVPAYSLDARAAEIAALL